MKNKIVILLFVALLAACGKKASVQNQDGEKRTVPISVREIKAENAESHIVLSGTLLGINESELQSEVSGKVVEVYKNLGDWIAKDEALARIDNEDYKISLEQAKAALLAAEASYEAATLSMQAAEELKKKNSIAAAEYSLAVSSFKQAKAAKDGAQAGLEKAQKILDASYFKPPISGYLTDLPVGIGSYVAPGTTVATVVDYRQMLIKTGVGEADISSVKKGQKVEIVLEFGNATAGGTVRGVGLKPQKTSGTYPLEVVFTPPQKDFLPGLTAKVKIRNHVYENVISIAQNDIITEYDNHYVYVAKDGKAEKRKVTLGKTIAENVIVASGLANGDLLVVDGKENLENDNAVEIKHTANN